MHAKAKQRIAEAQKAEPKKPIRISIPAGADVFGNFILALNTLCDKAIASDKLTTEQKAKAVYIKSRIATII